MRTVLRLALVVGWFSGAAPAAAARIDGAWNIGLDGCFTIDGGPSDCTMGALPITVVQRGNQLTGTLRVAEELIPASCNPQCLPATDPACQYVYVLNGTVTGNAVNFEINITRYLQATSCMNCDLQEAYVDRLTASGTLSDRRITGTWNERLDANCQASTEECRALLNCTKGNGSGTFAIDLPPLGACYGDCDVNGTVSVREAMSVIEHALSSLPTCSRADGNSDGRIAVEDAVQAARATDGCQ